MEAHVTEVGTDHSKGLCGKPDVPENTPVEAVEKKPAHCLCCGSEMQIVRPVSASMSQLGVYALTCPTCPKKRRKIGGEH